MEITNQLKEIIINRRKELELTLTDVSSRSVKTKSGKPALSVSTLSAIERGVLKGLKEETFRLLADILTLDVGGWMTDQRIVKVAFGPCCWAAPVINAIVKETDKTDEPLQLQNLWLSCYADNNNETVPLTTYNQSPTKDHHILTANETLKLLKNDKIDIAFLPVLTAERATGIVRIARCMNTAKGGIYLFVIGKKGIDGKFSDLEHNFSSSDDYDYEALKRIKVELEGKKLDKNGKPIVDEKSCCFLFPKGTMGQKIVESIFGETIYPKYELEISSTDNFLQEIRQRIEKHFEHPSSKYFVFAGWDYHIIKLKEEFTAKYAVENLVGKEFDSYRFTQYGKPFTMMSYDCVTLESKYEYLQKHPGLSRLLSILSEGVNELNLAKFKVRHPRYRLISDFLRIEQKFTDSILNRISWEFLIYPEMFDKNLK
jgi:transcriptional regulator with XRE-family HTH domain